MACVVTVKVEASAVPSSRDGGHALCDDCAWQECAGSGFCLKPFCSPLATLGLPLTDLERLQLLDEMACAPPKLIFIGVDLSTGPDLVAFVPPSELATVRQTGAGESSAVEARQTTPLGLGGGAPISADAGSAPERAKC
ncbi:hypothetical protein [Brevundimonas nasdae]|uniref:hypothetical protein n=1 Tax=Brevundimonas nasdae TaxID=172043 RepID=UPI003F68D5DF